MFRPLVLLASSAVAAVALTGSGAGSALPSSDGELIAFTSRRDGDSEIYVVRPDGGGLRKLTSNRVGDYRPAWSPDGTRIAFASDRDGNEELYVMRADGTGLRRLTRTPVPEGTPAWSPDGRRIAFTRSGSRGPEVWVMNASGSDARRVSPPARNGNGSAAPSWSPDGKHIAFGGSFATPENQEVYIVRPDGSGLRRLTRTRGDVHTLGDDGMPAWSPDGRSIAFTSNRGGDGEIWVMRPDGSGQRRLVGLPRRDDWTPAWSPDGARIVFASLALGESELYVSASTGGRLRRLARGEDPSWRQRPSSTAVAAAATHAAALAGQAG